MFFNLSSRVSEVFLPSPQASLFRAANAFRVTWSDGVFVVLDTSLKCADLEGLASRRIGTVPPYLLSSVLQPGTVGDKLLGSRDSCPCCCYQLEWNVHQLASRKQ